MDTEGCCSCLIKNGGWAWLSTPVQGVERCGALLEYILEVLLMGTNNGIDVSRRDRRIKDHTWVWGSGRRNAGTINWDGDNGRRNRIWGSLEDGALPMCLRCLLDAGVVMFSGQLNRTV